MAERIAIFGAGAVGSLVAARLAEAGHPVTLIARGERLRHLQAQGLVLQDGRGRRVVPGVPCSKADEAQQPDVLFLALKSYSLEAALGEIVPLIGANTMVVPLINGIPWWYFAPDHSARIAAVDPNGRLLAAFANDRLIGAVVLVNSAIDDEGSVIVTGPERLTIGRVDTAPCGRTQAVADMLSAAGLQTRTSPQIRRELWSKLALNLSSNPLSVVVESPLSDHYKHASLLPTVRSMLEETVSLAIAYGVEPSLGVDAMIAIGEGTGSFRTSMAQDFSLGRQLELSSIGHAVLELADSKGIAMPVTRMIVNLAHYQSQRSAAAA